MHDGMMGDPFLGGILHQSLNPGRIIQNLEKIGEVLEVRESPGPEKSGEVRESANPRIPACWSVFALQPHRSTIRTCTGSTGTVTTNPRIPHTGICCLYIANWVLQENSPPLLDYHFLKKQSVSENEIQKMIRGYCKSWNHKNRKLVILTFYCFILILRESPLRICIWDENVSSYTFIELTENSWPPTLSD